MILEKDLKKVFKELVNKEVSKIALGASDITIRLFDSSKLSLSTQVYHGDNFIPKSVRNCISQKKVFPDSFSMKTSLSIDEENYQVFLNYLGHIDSLDDENFRNLLEEFNWLADEWRLFLDEHDKNDLVPIHVKR